jgi:hypothetical protein
MSCVLRAWGEAFDVDAFLVNSPLEPETVYEKGQLIPNSGGEDRGRRSSGFNLTVSDAGFDDLEAQILGAIFFLDEYEDELRRLGSYSGVEGVSIDFGVLLRDVVTQTDTFPSDLLWRAGALDIDLQVTHYPIAEVTDSEDAPG